MQIGTENPILTATATEYEIYFRRSVNAIIIIIIPVHCAHNEINLSFLRSDYFLATNFYYYFDSWARGQYNWYYSPEKIRTKKSGQMDGLSEGSLRYYRTA